MKLMSETNRMQVLQQPEGGFTVHHLSVLDPKGVMAMELAKVLAPTKLSPEEVVERSVAIAKGLEDAMEGEGWFAKVPKYEQLAAMAQKSSATEN